MSNFTCLLKNVCLNYTKDKTSEVLHCMVFIRTMNIYTQLNVYMWMYLRNSRTVLIILVKSSVGKQGRKCLPFMLTIWSPPLPQLLHRRQKTHTCHTHKHARMYTNHQMPYSHPRDDLQTVVSKQTNPNLQQWQNWCRCINRFCSQWMLSPVIFQAACHFMSFMYDTNYVYKCIPTSIQHFLNAPGCHYLLQVKSWKPCEL